MEFLSALLAIIIIDLVLASDNAIVIALAARNVPKHLQRRATVWGTAGAILVRTSMTLIVVWLLAIPGKNHRRLESRISARLASFARQGVVGSPAPNVFEGGHTMLKVLVAVDGSPNSQRAVRHVINEFAKNRGIEVHLLNVQAPFSMHIAQFASSKDRDSFHREAKAQSRLRSSGPPTRKKTSLTGSVMTRASGKKLTCSSPMRSNIRSLA